MIRTVLFIATLALLAGCDRPPPDPDAPPDPQASALRDTIAEPLDKAKAVEDTSAERDAARDHAIEDAGG
jgi:hypothetical protein